MSTYLAGYGAGDERKSKLIRRAVQIGLAAIAVLLVGYFGLRNFSERSMMDRFIALLQTKDYPAAYALWGCSEQTPCRDYSYERFLRDWGPESPAKNAASAKKIRAATCGGILANTGVLRIYQFEPDYEVSIWVEKSDNKISFAPVIGRGQCTILP
ncbi:MAG: hypothetical protein SFV18_14295 [Bryobacteraceae bacterium]|nr:hypothetical protein [Bryobacteraceae bacterium]